METCSVGPLRRAPAPAECGHGRHLKEVTGQIPWLCDHRAQRERLCQTWETITKGPAGGLGTAESGELEAAEGAQEGAGPGAGSSGSLVLRAVVAARWVEWSTLGRQGQVIMDKKKRWWHRGRGAVVVMVVVGTRGHFRGILQPSVRHSLFSSPGDTAGVPGPPLITENEEEAASMGLCSFPALADLL